MAQICGKCNGDGGYWSNVAYVDRDGKTKTKRQWNACTPCGGSGEMKEETR